MTFTGVGILSYTLYTLKLTFTVSSVNVHGTFLIPRSTIRSFIPNQVNASLCARPIKYPIPYYYPDIKLRFLILAGESIHE